MYTDLPPVAPLVCRREREGGACAAGRSCRPAQGGKDEPNSFRSSPLEPRHLRLFGARQKIRADAFTVVELMIVVAIIGIMAGLAIPTFAHVIYRVQVTRAIGDIKTIEVDVAAFEMENFRVPNDLAEINRANLKDPWGNPYQYLSFAAAGPSWKGSARKDHSLVPLNSTYDLYSMGPDGDSKGPLTAKASRDDIVRANDGGFVGPASEF